MATSVFGGQYNARLFNYGGTNSAAPPNSPQVLTGNSTTGSSTIQASSNKCVTIDSLNFAPFSTNAPISLGIGANRETVTPTAVGGTSNVGFAPNDAAVSVSASFTYIHGPNEQIASGTFGLQEAINFAASTGSGTVIVDAEWYILGGTLAMILAATIPVTANALGVSMANTIRVLDVSTLTSYALRYSTNTLLAAPTIPLSSQLASLTGVTGTFAASTTYFNFVYVDAKGGLTAASSQYSVTPTVNLAVGGSGPIAETGAVGYLVYSSTTTTTYQAPVAQVTGAPAATIITCGAVKCFQIGTPFAIAAAGTNALAVVPVEATAYAAAILPIQQLNFVEPFNAVFPPFAATGVVTFGTALEWGRFDLPAGQLNSIGRALEIEFWGTYTPVSTATLILSMELYSVYGHTGTVVFTLGATVASTGTAAANLHGKLILVTSATGATGTVECHGVVEFQSVTSTAGTTGAAVVTMDGVQAVSGSVDLTKQLTASMIINSGTANLTTSQIRILKVTQIQ